MRAGRRPWARCRRIEADRAHLDRGVVDVDPVVPAPPEEEMPRIEMALVPESSIVTPG